MYELKIGELEDYVKRIGVHINNIHLKIIEIEKKINAIEENIAEVKTKLINNTDEISSLSKNTVQKIEFEEFVSRLTESLRGLLPSVSATNELTPEEKH